MKKSALITAYLLFLLITLSISASAAWPPPGNGRNVYHVDQTPVLNADPWGDPGNQSVHSWEITSDYSKNLLYLYVYGSDFADYLFGALNGILGNRFGCCIIYLNSTHNDYGQRTISTRIIYR
jgi:hypothetical protein